MDTETGIKLYEEAERIWMNALTTSNRFGPGIDYDGLKAELIEKYYEPAAEYGCSQAMFKCANYFKDKNPFLSAKYMAKYLKSKI